MPFNDILDDTNEARQPQNEAKRATLLRWIWRSLTAAVILSAMPSFIMYNWSPSQVNNVSPIEAHVLVFGLFGLAAVALIGLIVLLIWRWQLR
jgi:nitrate reductase NapE component